MALNPGMAYSLWQKFIIEPIARLLFLDPESGAQTTLYCALQEGIEPLSGRYFFCCAAQDVVAKGKDDAVAKKLWEASCLGYLTEDKTSKPPSDSSHVPLASPRWSAGSNEPWSHPAFLHIFVGWTELLAVFVTAVL
ncbi:hypothetical protein J4Q44_G00069640 [Coregonus suidteri]|uniref:Uncharacterized protein n=1 Tax=Coregonus suidteri TaxID=861788 RepID=A0AAN8M863_9TELE